MKKNIDEALTQYRFESPLEQTSAYTSCIVTTKSKSHTLYLYYFLYQESMESYFIRLMSLLNMRHPNLGSIHDFGHDEKHAYVVSSSLQGKKISEDLMSSKISSMDKLLILRDVTAACYKLHTKDIAHGSLTPASIYHRKTTSGSLGRLEIPLPKELYDQYQHEVPFSALQYHIYPEFGEQIANTNPTPQTDVYALGRIFYEIITKTQLFSAENLESYSRLVQEGNYAPPSSFSERIPKLCDFICTQALSNEISLRYYHAGEFLHDLNLLLDGLEEQFSASENWAPLERKSHALKKQLRQTDRFKNKSHI